MKKPSLMMLAALLCCILVLFPVVCSILYFSTSVANRLEADAQGTASFYIDNLAEKASSTLDTLRGSVYYLMSDSRTRRIMHSADEPTHTERLSVEESLNRAFFLGNQLDQSTVTGIYLVKDNQRYLSVLRSGIYLGTSTRVAHVYNAFREVNSARELYVDPAYPDYCYLIVDYFDLDTLAPLGKIIIELSIAGLADTSYLTAIYPESVVMLRATDGRILSGQDAAFAEAALAGGGRYVNAAGEEYYHISRQLSPSRVLIDVFVPRSAIFATSHEAIKIYLFFASAVLLLTLAAGAAAVYLLSKPLRHMLEKVNRLAAGDLTARVGATPYWETERMGRALNEMADHLEDLFGEVYEQGVLLRDAEFKLLESQIRPHFIFNVLELINIRCLEAGQNEICHMVSNLAQLLRANITHRHEQAIPLREELRYVRYYLELQKERFADSLSYSIDLEDPSILDYYLPKLTIQPLVENSIVHWLEPKRGGGSVYVGIWEDEDALYIRVSDDGVGFDASGVDLEISAEGESRHNHIALANIVRRLQLLYGERGELKIVSAPGKGAEITVILPPDSGGQRRGSDA